MRYLFLISFFLVIALGCGGKRSGEPFSGVEQEIYILHAGSLSVPFKEMAAEFKKKNPNYSVKLEAHGSRTCARQITDLGRAVDVMASADSTVIRNLLMPDFADFCIDFTTNEMAIMYNKKSYKQQMEQYRSKKTTNKVYKS